MHMKTDQRGNVQSLEESSFFMRAAGWELRRDLVGLKEDMTERYYPFTPIAAFLSDLTEHWSFLKDYVNVG